MAGEVTMSSTFWMTAQEAEDEVKSRGIARGSKFTPDSDEENNAKDDTCKTTYGLLLPEGTEKVIKPL